MSELASETLEERVKALHRRMAEHYLGGHWQPRRRNPSPKLVPHLWPWSIIYDCLMESGEVIKLGRIDEAAKRRTVNLVNPSLTDFKATKYPEWAGEPCALQMPLVVPWLPCPFWILGCLKLYLIPRPDDKLGSFTG